MSSSEISNSWKEGKGVGSTNVRILAIKKHSMEMVQHLDSSLLAQRRPRWGNWRAVAGGAEHAGGRGAAEGGLGNPFERSWGH